MKTSSAVSSLQAHLGYWLRFASNNVSHAFRLKVEAHRVTVAEWVVLRSLFEVDPISPGQLASSLGMTRGTISKLVDRLVSKKLVRCTVEKADRRFQSLVLAPPGRKLVPILAALADQNDAEFFGHLTDEQESTLVVTLKEIVRRRGLSNVPVD
jgi:DNA-binding MarR family transcriptional regulator